MKLGKSANLKQQKLSNFLYSIKFGSKLVDLIFSATMILPFFTDYFETPKYPLFTELVYSLGSGLLILGYALNTYYFF